MSKVQKKGPVSPEMNMTPLIDVTFQLIIFFMLVNNIIAEEVVEMLVPKLEDPQVRELDEGNRLTVNIIPINHTKERTARDGNPWIDGHAERVKLGSQMEFNIDGAGLDALKEQLVDAKKKNPKIEIILRSDAATHYDSVQPVMEAITAAGISRINMMAYQKDQGPKVLDINPGF